MKNKKVLALLVSLVLIVAVALPGTLAVSSDQDAVNSGFTVDTASPAPETATPAPETASPAPETATPAPETQETTGEPEQAVAPEIPEPVLTCTCDPAPAEGEAHKEGCPLAPLSCTCDPSPLEGEEHKEGCPLTCACVSQPLTGTIHKEGCPLAPLSCTCDPAPLEGEEHKEGCPLTCTCVSQPLTGTIHKEGCPLCVAPEAPAVINHIETCLEGCTGEDCKCLCHLFDRLMACQTLEEIEAIIKATPEDVLKSLSEEQVAQVEAYMDSLMPAPLPAIVIEESEPPVESEIYRPTVNYTNVAPFGEPVTGGN